MNSEDVFDAESDADFEGRDDAVSDVHSEGRLDADSNTSSEGRFDAILHCLKSAFFFSFSMQIMT